MAVLDELFSPQVVWHSATGRELRGLSELKKSFDVAYSTFPDTHYVVDDMIVEGGKAVTRFTFTGTHKGEFMGILPTGKSVKTWAIAIMRIDAGKVAEVWERYDTMGWMNEIGFPSIPCKRV